jgi:hypothetical protein
MFAFITQNWRGKPLPTHKIIVQLIAATSTASGLTVASAIDATDTRKGQESPTLSSPRSMSDTPPFIPIGTTPYFRQRNAALPQIEAFVSSQNLI